MCDTLHISFRATSFNDSARSIFASSNNKWPDKNTLQIQHFLSFHKMKISGSPKEANTCSPIINSCLLWDHTIWVLGGVAYFVKIKGRHNQYCCVSLVHGLAITMVNCNGSCDLCPCDNLSFNRWFSTMSLNGLCVSVGLPRAVAR